MTNDTISEEHESFAMIGACRKHGGSTNLFGSSVRNQNTIEIKIKRAVKNRSLNRNRYFGKEELITVELSPAQFADFITTMNNGDGVPCTLRRYNGEGTEPCPEFDERQIFEDEFKKKVQGVNKKMNELTSEVDALLDKKSLKKSEREDLKSKLRMINQEMNSNIPFIQSQFVEKMDSVVQESKSEVEAHIAQRKESLAQSILAQSDDMIGNISDQSTVLDSDES